MKPKVYAILGSLVVLSAALHWAARFDLRGPDSMSRDGFERWVDDPALVAMTALRWLALALSYYLFIVVAIVGLIDDPNERSGFRRLIPPRLAGTVGALLGSTAVLVPLATHMVTTAPTPIQQEAESALRLAPVEEPLRLAHAADGIGGHDEPADVLSANPADRPSQTDDIWNVELGDHLWSIAEESLEDHWGRTDLTDAEVASYWKDVIAANEDRLVEPGNPDLILPGQALVLPPPPIDPARR